MEVDSAATDQAAKDAPAAPAAPAASIQPQSISSAAAESGQFIACMKGMYRRVPLETMLNRCVCVPCAWLCASPLSAHVRRGSNGPVKQDCKVLFVRSKPQRQAFHQH